MDWKFRPDFQIMPGIKLSYGTDGIKAQIQDFVNTNEKEEIDKGKLKHQLFKPYDVAHEIKSGDIDNLTPNNLREFKSLLLASSKAFNETNALLTSKTTLEKTLSNKLMRLKKSLFRFLFKKKILNMTENVQHLQEEIAELQQQIEYSIVSLQINSEDSYKKLFDNIRKCFSLLSKSAKKWDFTSTKRTNRVVERTSAANTITRSEINLSEKQLSILNAAETALCFENINGGNLYLYPGFLIMYESKTEFAIIDYKNIKVDFARVRFIETEKVPVDSKIIDQTWAKVNKDGSRDKRFADNYQIPIVAYGELHFSSDTGLNEVYCFSDPELAMMFEKAFNDYCNALKTTLIKTS